MAVVEARDGGKDSKYQKQHHDKGGKPDGRTPRGRDVDRICDYICERRWRCRRGIHSGRPFDCRQRREGLGGLRNFRGYPVGFPDDRSDQTIPHLGDSLDDRIIMEGPPDFADRANKNILADHDIWPDLALHRLARADFAWLRGQGQQHLHDFRLKMDRLSIPFQCIQARMDNPVADLEIPVQKILLLSQRIISRALDALPRKPSELLFENKRLSEHRKIFGKRFSIFPRHSKLSIATLIPEFFGADCSMLSGSEFHSAWRPVPCSYHQIPTTVNKKSCANSTGSQTTSFDFQVSIPHLSGARRHFCSSCSWRSRRRPKLSSPSPRPPSAALCRIRAAP